jgi:hypothetical protein
MELKETIKIWKDLGVERAVFNFSCGGDSMNDFSVSLEDANGKPIESAELVNFFEDQTFKHVSFYEASDGHYIGEAGTVEITLNEDDDEGEPFFDYCKNAQSEYNENVETVIEIELNKKQLKFINDNVVNINGGENGFVMNYKRDFIMTDEEEKIAEEIEEFLQTKTSEFQPDTDDEVQEWYSFTTNEGGGKIETLTTTKTGLKVIMNNSVITYEDSDY